MKEVVAISRPSASFNVFWHLTDFCNYKCHYCPAWLKAGDFHQGRKAGFPTDEEIHEFLDKLENVYLAGGRKLHMMLSGGEPTIHPMFAEIIKRCKPYGVVSITSNGSRPLNWWKALPELPSGINMSLHHESTDINKINLLVDFLTANNVQVRFNMVCDPAHWEASIALFDGLRPAYQKWVMAWPLHDQSAVRDRDIYSYTEEQQAWMTLRNKRLANYRFAYGSKFKDEVAAVHFADGSTKPMGEISETTFKLTKMNYFKDWECYAGTDGIDINFSGDVWSSICKAVKLGRINNFNLLNKPIICEREICIHPADLSIRKNKA